MDPIAAFPGAKHQSDDADLKAAKRYPEGTAFFLDRKSPEPERLAAKIAH